MTTQFNEQAISNIINSETFKVTARDLSSQLHIKLPDAQQLLITEITMHRHNLDDATMVLTGKQRASINYAKKDLIRANHKASNAEMKLFVADEDGNGNSIVDNQTSNHVATTSYSEGEVQRALTVIPMAFQKTTAKYLVEVLTEGEGVFKQRHNWTTSYFNKQMKQWVKTAKEGNARKKLDGLLKSDSQIQAEENKAMAVTFLQMVDEEAPNDWIINWLQQSIENPFFYPAWDAVKYQGILLKYGFSTQASRKEAYRFINKLNELI